MRYEDALEWLYGRQKFGIKQGLENMQALLKALDHPEKAFPSFHVTGSNGKGSVCAFLEEGLRASGFRPGRYISPHLSSFCERIAVEGKDIPRPDVALVADQLRPVVEDLDAKKITSTFFECVTALAFLYFRRRKVDVAVVEVGMGGRWDATNVVEPVASVITNVSLEHTDRLGSTVGQIAKEKAGIIKPGVPVFTHAVGDAYDELRRRSKELGAPLTFISTPEAKESLTGTDTSVAFGDAPRGVRLAMLGKHQAENAALAAAALESGQDRFPLTLDKVLAAFSKTKWPGRLEPASKDPLVLLDGAHNPAAVAGLVGFLERVVLPRRIRVLFGAMRDKDVPGMARRLGPVVQSWVTTTAPNGRALGAKDLANLLGRENLQATPVEDVVEAIRALHGDAHRDDVLVVTGSLFLVGAARSALLKAPTDPPIAHAVFQ